MGGGEGEFLGDPKVFRGGAEGDQSSLTELRGATIELTANEVGSLQYYRTLRGDQVNFMVKQTEYSDPPPHSPEEKMTGPFLSLLQLFRVCHI